MGMNLSIWAGGYYHIATMHLGRWLGEDAHRPRTSLQNKGAFLWGYRQKWTCLETARAGKGLDIVIRGSWVYEINKEVSLWFTSSESAQPKQPGLSSADVSCDSFKRPLKKPSSSMEGSQMWVNELHTKQHNSRVRYGPCKGKRVTS